MWSLQLFKWTTLNDLVFPCAAWAVIAKLGITQTCSLSTDSLRSLGKTHSTVILPLTSGTTLFGRPGICTSCGGLSSFTKRVSSTCLPCGPLLSCQPTTNPSCPLVMQSSVASLFLIMTGIPRQRDSFPAKCPVAPGRSFQISCWSSKSISFDSCLCLGAALDFPHFLFVAESASLPHLSIK